MDDILTCIRQHEEEELLNLVNGLQKNLTFTIEREEDTTLPFLDMTIHREDGKLSSAWYRKPTDTGVDNVLACMCPYEIQEEYYWSDGLPDRSCNFQLDPFPSMAGRSKENMGTDIRPYMVLHFRCSFCYREDSVGETTRESAEFW